jgi:hypothetical protein
MMKLGDQSVPAWLENAREIATPCQTAGLNGYLLVRSSLANSIEW